MRRLAAVALAAVLVLTVSGTAFAAKGGSGGSSANTISVLGPVAAARTAIPYGSTVGTFSTYDQKLTEVYVDTTCVANGSTVTTLPLGSKVYDVMHAIRQGTWSTGGYAYFDTTASSAWSGGGADCSASLMTFVWHTYSRVWRTLATATFTVG